jgi:pyruvate/2-oxoglutarate dehydrogenase complex dihydrolipoamide dehydrogenase (E3) component
MRIGARLSEAMKNSDNRSTDTVLDIDVCAIGAGSGGLSITRFATKLGLSCVLIERGAMGGDCLNGGCVPSKALLAAGHAAAHVRRAGGFGVRATVHGIADRDVYRHVRDTVAWVAPNDSQERYESYGATVIREDARFVSPQELRAGPYRVRARWFFIATGARAVIPAIPGLDTAPYLTNETIFALKRLPRHLVVIGAGPLGIEMAQAHARLGARVTVLEKATMLPNEDPELVDYLHRRLAAERIKIVESAAIKQIKRTRGGVEVVLATNGRRHAVRGSHLLVAAGRRPEIAGLDLAAAGVRFTEQGIEVDKHLRTTNPRIYAVGDVVGSTQLSHLASHHATVAFANAVYRAGVEVEAGAVPRVLYTEPELAQVGLKEADARRRHRGIHVLRWTYDRNDRAAAERTPWGMIKVIVDRNGRILGVGIVGPHAGEVIQKWTLAISAGLDIQAVAATIAPYPTIGYSDRKLAESFRGPAILACRRHRTGALRRAPAAMTALQGLVRGGKGEQP